ncbi:tetratricopeptide repeat protein [Elizabethkingia sp. HX XZB]|uniref:tetratricopeptide repeat protein n=1 Tax=Elizabethkingia sp. HX XZB TaxID=3003193 RepID=UPI002A23AAB2|nr:tetratricopeptide repeat protein [Elizabethkingia sp. HX XZB]MDX8568498.1 tetratricopeptide repeat protein [Elizabethkingia sp. HX XZB]
MNKNKMKSVKQVVIGMLLLGSVNVAYAQTTDSTKQSQPTDQAKQQDNNALVKEAIAYQDKQDWTNALATWKKVSTSIPDWAPAYYGQGYVYQSMKDKANAQASFEKFIATVKPEEVEANKQNLAYAHMYVAFALYETNKEEAKKHIAKALEYDPNNEDAKKLSKSINQ